MEKEGGELDPDEREVLLLSEDIIEEILVRLPIKPLKRFKTVSKRWLRLISSPRFAFKHYSITKAQTFNNPSGVAFFILRIPDPDKIRHDKSFITPITVNQQPHHHHHPVVKINPNIDLPHHAEEEWKEGDLHLNWLFPAGFGIYCIFEDVKGAALLWNPTTGQTKLLPPSPYYQSFNGAYVYHFAKLDYHQDEAAGGNFSYKVGRVITNYVYHDRGGRRSTHLSLELFSSKTKSWRLIPDFCSGDFVGYADWLLHTANLNGMAHWVIRSQNENDIFITTFDYETNVFGKIKAPSAPPEFGGHHYDNGKCIVTSYNDKFLCLVLFFLNTNDDDGSEFLDIWVMREYGVEDSWTKEFTVGPIPMKMEVLGFSSKLQGIFLRPRYGAPTPLLFCDCKSSTIKRYHLKTNIYQHRRILLNLLQVVERESSLVSIE